MQVLDKTGKLIATVDDDGKVTPVDEEERVFRKKVKDHFKGFTIHQTAGKPFEPFTCESFIDPRYTFSREDVLRASGFRVGTVPTKKGAVPRPAVNRKKLK